ncbi:MAG: hypothetical protein OEV36_04230 [Myxococcales bacterium]|nr:hypothetical protein [Myxococcales bacterium]
MAALICCGALALTGCGSDGGSNGSGGSGGGGTPPTITMVAWEAAAGCAMGVRSDVVVTVTAAGTGALTISGSVAGCTGPIDAAVSTVSCPNVATYPGTVMVSDGTESTTVTFDVQVCDSGSCTTDPDTCS